MPDRRRVFAILAAALLIAGVLSFFASSRPDGLEHALESVEGPSAAAQTPHAPAPFPDYQVPGVESPFLANALAGIAGVLVTFLLLFAAGRLLTRGRRGGKTCAP